MAKDIIAVVGATGAQGGGLVRAALADPHGRFAVRALTRKPEEAKAEALRKLGAEVVGADLDEAASLAKAFAGARCAYCVTNFWEHFSPERELAQAKNMAQAARSAGLRHVIWSTLEDTRLLVPLDDDRMPTLKEHYKVPHFDAKGSADVLFRQAEVPHWTKGLPWTQNATSISLAKSILKSPNPKNLSSDIKAHLCLQTNITMWTKQNIPDQTGKTIIVTGANTGIGYETALAFI